MVQHTIFGSGGPAAVQNSDTSGLNLATAFYVTSGTTWTAIGIRFWLDAASNAPLTGYQGWLSSGANAQSMSALASVAFTGVAKGGWNTATFNSPVALAVGTKYWVVVYFPGGCYSASAHMFDSPVQSLDGSALYGAGNSEVRPGNGAYDYGPASQMSAAGSYNATWYGVDVITDDGLLGGGVVPHHLAIGAAIGKPRWKAGIGSARWASTLQKPRWKAAIMGPTTLPAATAEYLPLTVTRNGPGSAVPITAGCSYSIVAGTVTAPGTWTACTIVDGSPSALISGMTAGTYTVFVQVAAGTETVVRNLGQIVLT